MRGGSRQERRWSNCIGCWCFVVDGDVVVVVVVVVDDDVVVDVVVVDDGVVILVNLFVGEDELDERRIR